MRVLRAKLQDQAEQEAISSMAADRKSQVGTGDRSERIRTYNYPQGRVTDHRINLTLYKLDAILNGDLDEIIQALNAADQAAKCRSQYKCIRRFGQSVVFSSGQSSTFKARRWIHLDLMGKYCFLTF